MTEVEHLVLDPDEETRMQDVLVVEEAEGVQNSRLALVSKTTLGPVLKDFY